MKKFIPRLIAFGILFLLAAVELIGAYTTELLIIEASLLALIALFMFCGEDQSLVRSLPAFAIGWALFAILIPEYSLSAEMLGDGISRLWDVLGRPFRSKLIIIGLISFIALQVFFRTKDRLFFIIVRYIAAFLLLLGYIGRVSYNAVHFTVFIVLFSLIYELRSMQYGSHKRRTFSCILTALCYLLALCTYGNCEELTWSHCIPYSNIMIRVVIGVAIAGALLILEDYNHRANYNSKISTFRDLGPALLFWCGLCLCMHSWPTIASWESLIVLPMILYYCYGLFIRKWVQVTKGNERNAMLVAWTLITVWLLLFSKSLVQDMHVAVVMVVLLIAGVACWSVSAQRKSRDLVMCCYYGVAAAAMLFISSLPIEAFSYAFVIGKYILALILSAVIWCILCTTTNHIHNNSSSVYSKEFSDCVKIEKFVPLTFLAVTVIVLFVR
ncbi:MAG: hypothetical protein IKM59_04075 [Oscillospiraceae bacterium]|nr:hypothetical protein [Oscillospiraceae bacterium]